MMRVLMGYLSMIAGGMIAVPVIAFEPWGVTATWGLVTLALVFVGAGYFGVMWDEM